MGRSKNERPNVKTAGMSQQLEALRLMAGREYFALFMEQGTGKTWTLLADAERLYAAGHIDALLVIAPNGVHTNWVRREIPEHLDCEHIAKVWRSGLGKRALKKIEAILTPREPGEIVPLRILAMHIDSMNTRDGFEFALRFLRATRAAVVVDESGRIKNLDALRTRRVIQLKPLAPFRRIATGTPITKAPLDVFAQMEFLAEGLLGTTSYRAFVAEYADLAPLAEAMETIKKIRAGRPTTNEERAALNRIGYQMRNKLERNPRMAFSQIVERDEEGQPRWRNLEKLQRLLAPHSYRVLKKDCLDLPEKIYKTHFFALTPKQLEAYELLRDELRIEAKELDEPMPVQRLAALVKLQQITSGFVMVPSIGLRYVSDDNPRLAALVDMIEDIDGKIIVWARFKEEIAQVARELREAGRNVVEYHGAIGKDEREAAIDSMQNGDADVFVGNAQSGGIGITLTAAATVIYYSNDFNYETRAQSEDRAHRIGQTRNVEYIDLVATETIDEDIAKSLQRKKLLAETILGDRR